MDWFPIIPGATSTVNAKRNNMRPMQADWGHFYRIVLPSRGQFGQRVEVWRMVPHIRMPPEREEMPKPVSQVAMITLEVLRLLLRKVLEALSLSDTPDHIETDLIDNPPASRADIQAVPPRRRLDLSPFPRDRNHMQLANCRIGKSMPRRCQPLGLSAPG
jgi:hypothetical protein